MKVVVIDGQCYYEHGHWMDSVDSFIQSLPDHVQPVVFLPRRARQFECRYPWLETAKFVLPDLQPYGIRFANFRKYSGGASVSIKEKIRENPLLAVLHLCRGAPSGVFALSRSFFSFLASVIALRKALARATAVLVPTGDNPKSLRALRRALLLLPTRKRPQVSLRFVNSESQGVQTWLRKSIYGLPRLTDVRLGFENPVMFTNAEESLMRLGLFSSSLMVPYPPKNAPMMELSRSTQHSPKVRIGILGAPRASKGYFDLPDLLRAVEGSGIELEIWIQTMKGYDPVRDELSTSHSLVDLGFFLSRFEFDKAIASIDVMVLPYSRDVYSETGSAMLYESCDYLKPVIAASGTGFAAEVAAHGLGFLLHSPEELPQLIQKVSTLEMKLKLENNLREYNRFRREQVADWINLSSIG